MTSLSAPNPLYTSLHEWQTRLLCLQPGQRHESLQVTLHVVDLIHAEGVQLHGTAQRVKYEALSYTWGDPKILRHIQVNGTVFDVTENLYHALLDLRTEQGQRWLWIDAVCIHQTDLEEKSQHLRRMFLIFRKAYRVLVFLGQSGPNTTRAFEYLRPQDGESLNKISVQDVAACDEDSRQYEELSKIYEGLKDLWTRPWLWRVWVRQEVFAARKVMVLCGDDQVEWGDFMKLARGIERLTPELRSRGYGSIPLDARKVITFDQLGYSEMRALSRILHDEYPDERGSQTDIVQVLNRSIGCEMSDPRDLVYGILGMTKTTISSPSSVASEEQATRDRSLPLVVDYSRDLTSVFLDLGKYIVNRDGLPHVLYLCQESEQMNDLSLPSWCPNWKYETVYTISDLHDEIRRWIRWNQGNDGILPPKAMSQYRSAAGELVAEGIVLGEIVDDCDLNSWPNCACNVIEKDAKTSYPCYELDPPKGSKSLLQYFERYQKNGHVQLQAGVLTEIETVRLRRVEKSAFGRSQPSHLACGCFNGLEGHPIASNIPTVISTMLSHFWAVPKGATRSDILVSVDGGLVPVVLRPDHPGYFRYIGPATLCQGPYRFGVSRLINWELLPYLYTLISQLVDARDSLQTFTLH